MDFALEMLALLILIGVAVVNLGGGIAALFFGRKLPWVWFALAMYESTQRLLSVALYREFDMVRGLGSLGGAVLAAALAILLQRRFGRIVLIVGGFLAAGLSMIQTLGPLLNRAPEGLVIGILLATGIAGAFWTRTNLAAATIVLSALVGAGILTDYIVDSMNIEEAYRFQVYAVLAMAGIGAQLWMRRRALRAAGVQVAGA